MTNPKGVSAEGRIFLHLATGNWWTGRALNKPANESIILDYTDGAAPCLNSRDTTPALSNDGTDETGNNLELVLSFDRVPKDQSVGYTIGCGMACDVVVARINGVKVSSKHLVVEVRGGNEVFLRSVGRHGTSITYFLPNYTTSSGIMKTGHSLCLYRNKPLASKFGIEIAKDIKFKISFPDHQDTCLVKEFQSGLANLYRQRCSAVPNLAFIDLENQPVTAARSQLETPRHASQTPQIYLDQCEISQTKWSIIYHTVDARTGCDVVAKELKTDYIMRARAGQKRKAIDPKSIYGRFKQEAELMRMFEHPNLIRLHDFVAEGPARIYMPWYPDGDLRRYKLTGPQCDSMAIQLMRALESLHGNGIIHRDVKPANVLVDTQGGALTFVLADFNTAIRSSAVGHEQVPKHRTFCGTPRYAAPEQLTGEHGILTYDKAVDLFSAGVLYIENRSVTLDENVPETTFSKSMLSSEGTVGLTVREQVMLDLGRQIGQIQSRTLRCDVPWMMLKTVDPSPRKRWSAARCLDFCAKHGLARLVDGPGEVTAEVLELKKARAGTDSALDTEVLTEVLWADDSVAGLPPPTAATVIRDAERDELTQQPSMPGPMGTNEGGSLTESGWPKDIEEQIFPSKADELRSLSVRQELAVTTSSPTLSQLSEYVNAVAERLADNSERPKRSQRGSPASPRADGPEDLNGSSLLPQNANEQTLSSFEKAEEAVLNESRGTAGSSSTGSDGNGSFGRYLLKALRGQPPTTASLPSTATASPLVVSPNTSTINTPPIR